jgi:hypothetical protein
VLAYRTIPGPVRQRLGRGNAAVAFMRLGNADDAKAASEQIGTEHRFVISQLTDTVGLTVTDAVRFVHEHGGRLGVGGGLAVGQRDVRAEPVVEPEPRPPGGAVRAGQRDVRAGQERVGRDVGQQVGDVGHQRQHRVGPVNLAGDGRVGVPG